MKKLLFIIALAAPALAQDAPPAGTPPATTTTTATTAPVGKPKPLGAPDKKFIKDSLEGMVYIMDLTGKAKKDAKLDTVKKLGEGLKSDLDKVWADVGGIASDRGEKIPTELAGGDKTKAERLGKAGDRFDKEFTKLVSKETEKLAKTFETAGKSGQEPAVKEVAAKWTATLQNQAKKAADAEKEAAKSK